MSIAERKTTTSAAVKRRYNSRVYAKIQVELPREIVQTFKEKCASSGVSQASVILAALEKFIAE